MGRTLSYKISNEDSAPIKDYVEPEIAADFKKWCLSVLFLSAAMIADENSQLNLRVINTI